MDEDRTSYTYIIVGNTLTKSVVEQIYNCSTKANLMENMVT